MRGFGRVSKWNKSHDTTEVCSHQLLQMMLLKLASCAIPPCRLSKSGAAGEQPRKSTTPNRLSCGKEAPCCAPTVSPAAVSVHGDLSFDLGRNPSVCLSRDGLTSQCFEMNLTASKAAGKTACAIARVSLTIFDWATDVETSYFASEQAFRCSNGFSRIPSSADVRTADAPAVAKQAASQLFKGNIRRTNPAN